MIWTTTLVYLFTMITTKNKLVSTTIRKIPCLLSRCLFSLRRSNILHLMQIIVIFYLTRSIPYLFHWFRTICIFRWRNRIETFLKYFRLLFFQSLWRTCLESNRLSILVWLNKSFSFTWIIRCKYIYKIIYRRIWYHFVTTSCLEKINIIIIIFLVIWFFSYKFLLDFL